MALGAGAVLVASPARADVVSDCIAASEKGQVLEKQGKLTSARAEFLSCSRRECPGMLSTDCDGWLANVETKMPSVVFALNDHDGHDVASATVFVDGQPVAGAGDGRDVSLDPGEHDIRAEAPGMQPATEHIVVRVGEKRRVVRMLLESRGPRPIPVAAWVTGGIAAAGLVGFGVLYTVSHVEASGLDCAPRCPDSDVDPIRGLYIGSLVSLGIGAAFAIATGVIYYSSRPSATRSSAALAW